MDTRDWAIEMARYSRWQNETVYDRCAGLSPDDRTRDRGMYFGSILHTLDHILMVDTVLLAFIDTGEPPVAFDPNTVVHTDFDTLRAARVAFDSNLEAHLSAAAAPWFDEAFTFHNEKLGRDRTIPRWFYLTQMFNHGTHHRSQVTAELHKMGIDYGNTDMPYNPDSQY
jgi:uncharacterized damage-inducible protein DinB